MGIDDMIVLFEPPKNKSVSVPELLGEGGEGVNRYVKKIFIIITISDKTILGKILKPKNYADLPLHRPLTIVAFFFFYIQFFRWMMISLSNDGLVKRSLVKCLTDDGFAVVAKNFAILSLTSRQTLRTRSR